MTILIYDYCELEERAGKHLKVWKVWHIIIFAFAAIFGFLNYFFLQNTMYMVNDNCILVTSKLQFHMVEVYTDPNTRTNVDGNNTLNLDDKIKANGSNAQGTKEVDAKSKRELAQNETGAVEGETNNSSNEGNTTERWALDITNTYFGSQEDCQFAEYMPIMSTILALVWTTMFVMCPGGGHSRSGLTQPWRILTPALLSAVVLVGLTGHSFVRTNRGLHQFCAAFYNYTNTTACSPVNEYIERSWNASWSFSSRTAATRAASAGVWASWACAATLLLVRCLAAPDFQLKKTGVYLSKDPHQKITPHLRKGRRRTPLPSPNKDISIKSEPTVTTELVTASIEHADSPPPSPDSEKIVDLIDMSHLNPTEGK